MLVVKLGGWKVMAKHEMIGIMTVAKFLIKGFNQLSGVCCV